MFEAAIRTIAPAWALRREQSRLALQALNSMRAPMAPDMRYDGARMSRRTRGWIASETSANRETESDLPTLRARSRDLVRNNPYASAGLDLLVAYQIGTGIVPQSRTGNSALDAAANDLWNEWGAHADGTGRHDIWGIQAQAARARAEGGEALVLLRPMPASEWRRSASPVPLALHVWEPEHIYTALSTGVRQAAADGSAWVQGVRLDRYGRPQGYSIVSSHPGDTGWSANPVEVPAEYLLHVYRQDRPGQVRGVPDLAPVMSRLRMLEETEDAVFYQHLMQACFAAFVRSPAGAGKGPLEATSANGKQERSLSPGLVERLYPGEEVDFLTPSGNSQFAEFARHQLRAVATGFGLTYDLLTGDVSQANYSSLRAGRLAFRRRLESVQWQLLVPRLCQPVWDAFIAAAQGVGKLPPMRGAWPVEWAPPRFEMVDPLKDTLAIQMQLRLGLLNWGQAVAEMGWDAGRQADEIARWNEVHDGLGLILDGDPRRTANAGTAQNAAQNAAIEIAATGAVAPPATQGA